MKRFAMFAAGVLFGTTGIKAVSYTHLDVYKRQVYVNGEPLHHGGIHNAMRHKIGMIPANRKENSVIPDFTLLENLSLIHISR